MPACSEPAAPYLADAPGPGSPLKSQGSSLLSQAHSTEQCRSGSAELQSSSSFTQLLEQAVSMRESMRPREPRKSVAQVSSATRPILALRMAGERNEVQDCEYGG